MLQERGTTSKAAAHRADVAATDPALLAQVVRGDLAAFECLYRRYHPRLNRFLGRMMWQPNLVEETLNETMLVVWQSAHRYNLTSKVSTWVFGIAYRKALKAMKRCGVPAGEAADADQVAEEGEAGPESLLQQKETRALLGEAMKALSADQRAVVELTYYQGYSYPEIAEIMNCPVDTVKTRMFYARRRLKSLLAPRLEAEP
jgi:RNA polymerase sigma factor (sigma-70 family)